MGGRRATVVVLLALAVFAVVQAAAASSVGSRVVTRKQFGTAWPLTISGGILSCTGTGFGAVTFTAPNGTTFWVNGTAGDEAPSHGWRDIHPIWAKVKHPYFPGQRKDIGVLIDAGLKLCG
jgi:hypothetical protein